MTTNTPVEFKTCPAVFAVKNSYQIMVPVKSDLLFWVEVDGKQYFDHSNGIIRSSTRMHRVNVPMCELDKAKKYTVGYRKIIDRKPYFPETESVVTATYNFKPIPETGKINMYHLSDTHGNFDMSSKAGEYFGENLHLLILNGDIPNHSGEIENFDLIFQLCEHLTHGEIPCVFSRGNHDTRGFYAENIAEYTPTENGHSYFSFRLGRIWGVVVDCGEDKDDSNEEYGNTVSCHQFRLEENEYLENLIKASDTEYNAEGVDYRFVVSHVPFSYTQPAPFNIETELYTHWLKILGEHVKPQAFITGHKHVTEIWDNGCEFDNKGQVCPVIVGSRFVSGKGYLDMLEFVGCAITLDGDHMTVSFTNHERKVLESRVLKLEK